MARKSKPQNPGTSSMGKKVRALDGKLSPELQAELEAKIAQYPSLMHLIREKGLTFGTKFRIKKVLLNDPDLSAKLRAELGGGEELS